MKINPALVFVYNHCHPDNVTLLEKIYKDRFSNIYHLIPFYESKRHPNVIPVYDNSFYYQGFLAQGFNNYYSEDYSHYIFIADDFMLNPRLNESNFTTWFGLEDKPKDRCFFPTRFNNIGSFVKESSRTAPWAYNYRAQIPGLQGQKLLPSFSEALRYFQAKGLDTGLFKEESKEQKSYYYNKHSYSYNYDTYHQAIQKFNRPPRLLKNHFLKAMPSPLFILWKLFKVRNMFKPYTMGYPFAVGFSDILVIPAKHIKSFTKYLGVFAAANLYVDISISTAMILLNSPVTNGKIGRIGGGGAKDKKSLYLESSLYHEHWLLSDMEAANNFALGKQLSLTKIDHYAQRYYNAPINKLLSDFPSNVLGIHPIKLSQWH